MAYIYEAYRVWSPLDVGAIDDVGRNVISWSATTPEDTGITVSAGLSDADDVEPIEYVECTSGAEIPCIDAEADLTGKYLWVRVDFGSDVLGTTPELTSLYVLVGNSVLLTGTWTSPIYDLGSIQTVRIWGDFVTGIDSAELTWGGVFQAAETWGNRIAAGERWYQVWTPSVTGGLAATLKYGETAALDREITGFELTAPEISGRYVQVVIRISDPNVATHLYVKELTMKTAYWS